ncbi:hypothetical protein CsSME_00037780 [Camellia sinensis var. sinensis]
MQSTDLLIAYVSLREATEVYIVHWWQPFRPHSHSFESIYNIQRLAIWRYMEAAFFMDATKGDICSVITMFRVAVLDACVANMLKGFMDVTKRGVCSQVIINT